jgi:hypothetical protein
MLKGQNKQTRLSGAANDRVRDSLVRGPSQAEKHDIPVMFAAKTRPSERKLTASTRFQFRV